MATTSRAFQSISTSREEELSVARATIARYAPTTPAQASFQAAMLSFIEEHPTDAHERSCLPGHLTASCLLLDYAQARALLTHHAKLHRWLQLGGHLDGDANLPAAALREATEESGIPGIQIDPTPIDLDIHTIPARRDEPEHLHLDIRFLARAPAGAQEICSEESIELGWFTTADLANIHTDPSVVRLFQHAFAE